MTRYKTTNQHMLPMLEVISRMGYGTGFTILMEHEGKLGGYKDYSIHPRFDQPCQGGDMRKYSSSHGDICTQPHNHRPADLSQPFPSGKPSAAAFHMLRHNPSDVQDAFFNAVVSDESPWRKGFGGEKNIIRHLNNDGNIIGFTMENLDVDPTVLVNGLNFINRRKGHAQTFKTLIELGLSNNESLAFVMLNQSLLSLNSPDSYSFCAVMSARRFFEGKPHDYSGGLYSQGVDYNRTMVQDVFSASKDNPHRIVWVTQMKEKLSEKGVPTSGWTPEHYPAVVQSAKEIFDFALENEAPVEDEIYKYRDASFTIRPYPEIAMKINPKLSNTPKTEEKIVVKKPRKKAA